MKPSTVIWTCPSCGHWQWGNIYDLSDLCPVCSDDMAEAIPDRPAALETYFCETFHEMNEEPYRRWR